MRSLPLSMYTAAWIALLALYAPTIGCDGTAAGQDAGPQPAPDAATAEDAGLPDDPWQKAWHALGGEEAFEAIGRWQVEATGQRHAIRQAYTPGEGTVPISTFSSVHSRDRALGRLRLEHARIAVFFYGLPSQGAIVVDERMGIGAGAENIFGVPLGAMLPDRVASLNRQAALLHPWLLFERVQTGDLEPVHTGDEDIDGAAHHVIALGAGEAAIQLYIRADDGRLTRAATVASEPFDCHIEVRADYADWQAAEGGVLAPGAVTLSMDGEVVHDETRGPYAVDPELPADAFDWPEGGDPVPFDADIAERGAAWFPFLERFAHFGGPIEGLQLEIQAVPLAEGVWHVLGSHNTLVVEQAEGVVLVDPVLYPARTEALLTWLDETVPGKPVSHVILSHHHSDHTGGVKPLVDRGVPLVVGEAAEAVYPPLAETACGADPTQAIAAQPVQVIPVPEGGQLVLDDAERPIEIRDADNPHAADLVLPYLPNQGILFTVDVFSPGIPIFPEWAGALRDDIDRLGLGVQTLAGGHGGTATLDEFDALLGR